MDGLEDILKTIGTIVFVAIYLFGGQLFKSKDEEEQGPPTLPRQRGESQDTEDDYAARQRQIQEAIRRKILERRQASESEASSPEPIAAQRERRKEVAEQQKQVQQAPAPRVEPTPPPVPSNGQFSWDASDNAYEQQMQERLKAIEATKRRAEALKRQAGVAPAGASPQSSRSRKRTEGARGGLLSGSVRSTLTDPAAARAAFIYGEVLGKPVSMRASGSGVE